MYQGVDCKTSYDARAPRQVKRSVTIGFCLFVLLLAGGSLQTARVSAVNWTLAMNAGDWSNTIALTTLSGRLYTIEKSGALYRTDLTTGQWIQVGKPEFANTRFMFSDGRSLYTIETSGSLYRINPANGAWSGVGPPGAWKDTMAVVTLNGDLYSIERSGALYRTDLTAGRWVQVGKPEFANTRFVFSDSQNLYTIEANGSMYRVNPGNGSWAGIGSSGAWKNTIVGSTMDGLIYTVEQSGALFGTSPATGAWKQIGKADFGRTQFMFGTDGSLYTVEAGGLYRINPSTGSWVQVTK